MKQSSNDKKYQCDYESGTGDSEGQAPCRHIAAKWSITFVCSQPVAIN